MSADHHIVGLDIGAAKLCAVICDVSAPNTVLIKGIGTSVTSGFKRGEITDPDALKQSIQKALDRAKSIAGFLPKDVITTLPLADVSFHHHTGFVQLKQVSKAITAADIRTCFDRSKNIVKAATMKIAHAIPVTHLVDGAPVTQPEGTSGQELEIKTHLILAPKQALSSMATLLSALQLNQTGIMIDLMATAQVMLTPTQLQTGGILIDIGSRITRVGYFCDRKLVQATTIAIGGDTFTADIATCLNTSFAEAERIKILFGSTRVCTPPLQSTIKVTTRDGRQPISVHLLSQIIEARMAELMSLIKQTDWMMDWTTTPIHLCGGGSLIKDTVMYVEHQLGPSVSAGLPKSVNQWVQSPAYATAVGLVLAGLQSKLIRVAEPTPSRFNRLRSWSKNLYQKAVAVL